MQDLKTKIRNAAAFDEDLAESMRHSTDRDYWVNGAEWQHAQTQWLVEALCVAIDVLQYEPDYYKSVKAACALDEIAALVPKGES